MAHNKFGPIGAGFVAGLLLIAGGIAQANASEGDVLQAAADARLQKCDDVLQRHASNPRYLAVLKAHHRHKLLAMHKRSHANAAVAAAVRHEPAPVVVASNVVAPTPAPVSLAGTHANCSGANGWSILCPGVQLVGISY